MHGTYVVRGKVVAAYERLNACALRVHYEAPCTDAEQAVSVASQAELQQLSVVHY